MTTWKQLSPALRLSITAPWCLLATLLLAGAAGMIDVKLDPVSHQPTNTTVDLSGSHWTGTLDAARLPASVPRYDANGNVFFGGAFVGQAGAGLNFNNEGSTDGAGNWTNIAALTVNGTASFGGNVAAGGTVSGSDIIAANSIQIDNGPDCNFYLDAYGDGSFEGDLSVAASFSVNGFASFAGDLAAGTIFSGGYQVTDPSGDLFAGDHLIGTSDGYLQTVGQFYTAGIVAPTGSIAIKDGYGAVYLIPAVAQ